jgi:excisionase family DNA binding protein
MIEVIDSRPDHPDWMTVQEAADYLRLAVSAIRRLTRSGEIPSRRFTPRNTRYSRLALDKWAKDRNRG